MADPKEERLYEFRVKRERWKDGKYHSVARNAKGHMLSRRLWKSSESTKITQDVALYNYTKKREPKERFAPEETITPVQRTDIVTKQSQTETHKRYHIVCKVLTQFGSKWFIVIESDHKHLSKADIAYIKRALLRTYTPNKRNLVYTEYVTDVIPVHRKDMELGDSDEL